MRKKIAIAIAGLLVVVGGVVALSAFTAQQVNVIAHVEKEIEVDGVICKFPLPIASAEVRCQGIGDIDYGTVVPQVFYDAFVEVTASESFRKPAQTKFHDIVFEVLWECKQERPGFPASNLFNNLSKNAAGKYNPLSATNLLDTFPDCLDNLPHTDPLHPKGELDDNIRSHITVTTAGPNGSRCLVQKAPKSLLPTQKEVQYVGTGIVDLTTWKCIYSLKLLVPPCKQGFNPFTDPIAGAIPIDCHVVQFEKDSDKDGKGGEDPIDGRDNDKDGNEDGTRDATNTGNCDDGIDNGTVAGAPADPNQDDEGPALPTPTAADGKDGSDPDCDPFIDEDPPNDPQERDTFSDLGDDFKIQVVGHSLKP